MGNGPELTTLNGQVTPCTRQHQRLHVSANNNASATPNGHVSTSTDAKWLCAAVSMFLEVCSCIGMYFYYFSH
jgi:hypothetical protein